MSPAERTTRSAFIDAKRAEGWSYKAIAKGLGISMQAVSQYQINRIKAHEPVVVPPPGPLVAPRWNDDNELRLRWVERLPHSLAELREQIRAIMAS